MPDDTLFEHPGVEEEKPNGKAEAPPSLSAEDIAQIAAQTATKAVAPVVQELRQMAQPAVPESPPAELSDDDFLKRLTEDPKSAVSGLITDIIQKEVSPTISNMTTSASRAFIDLEKEDVDGQFGPGAWNKFFEPHWQVLEKAYQKSNPGALGDRAVIQREINSLKGLQVSELMSHKNEKDKESQSEQNEGLKNLVDGVAQTVTNLTGGLRVQNPDGKVVVTDEVRGYLKEKMSALGVEETPEEWFKATDFGNSLSDYKAHVAKNKKDSE